MPQRTVVEVAPAERRWKVQVERESRPVSLFDRKTDAVAKGRELAKSAPVGQLRIKRRDGTLETEYTYGRDPRNIPG